MMICRFRFRPFLVTPEHDHPHEQMTIVERGKVRFFVEGKERIASAVMYCTFRRSAGTALR